MIQDPTSAPSNTLALTPEEKKSIEGTIAMLNKAIEKATWLVNNNIDKLSWSALLPHVQFEVEFITLAQAKILLPLLQTSLQILQLALAENRPLTPEEKEIAQLLWEGKSIITADASSRASASRSSVSRTYQDTAEYGAVATGVTASHPHRTTDSDVLASLASTSIWHKPKPAATHTPISTKKEGWNEFTSVPRRRGSMPSSPRPYRPEDKDDGDMSFFAGLFLEKGFPRTAKTDPASKDRGDRALSSFSARITATRAPQMPMSAGSAAQAASELSFLSEMSAARRPQQGNPDLVQKIKNPLPFNFGKS